MDVQLDNRHMMIRGENVDDFRHFAKFKKKKVFPVLDIKHLAFEIDCDPMLPRSLL